MKLNVENFKSVVEDDYTSAQAYFGCVVGMVFLEGAIRLPSYLKARFSKGQASQKASKGHFKVHTALHKVATLPSPVPIVTNHTAPSLLRLAVFVLLNFVWGWTRIKYTGDYKRFGWMTIANGGVTLLFGARSNLFSMVTRVPSPVLLTYHRWAGIATFIHASLHSGLTIDFYVKGGQFDTVLTATRIKVGIMAWVALGIIFLLSAPGIIRRRWFELFYYPHFLFLVFVGGAIYHADHGPEFLAPGLALWGADRIYRFYLNFRKVEIKSITHYPGNVTKFKMTGFKPSHPGQIAWVQIPNVSFLNWHPFTIASAPGSKVTTIAVRGLGEFTKNVQKLSDGETMSRPTSNSETSEEVPAPGVSLRMRVDGPHGVGRIQWTSRPVIALVAGGIGITPGISIASHIIQRAAAGDVPRGGTWHVHLLWILREARHAAWFEDELKELATMAASSPVPVTFTVEIHVTTGEAQRMDAVGTSEQEMEKPYKYEGPGQLIAGRPNMLQFFQNVRDTRTGLDVSVNLCGPRKMVDDGRKAAAKASNGQTLFHVEEEVFNF